MFLIRFDPAIVGMSRYLWSESSVYIVVVCYLSTELVRVEEVDWGSTWISGRESYVRFDCVSVDWGFVGLGMLREC